MKSSRTPINHALREMVEIRSVNGQSMVQRTGVMVINAAQRFEEIDLLLQLALSELKVHRIVVNGVSELLRCTTLKK